MITARRFIEIALTVSLAVSILAVRPACAENLTLDSSVGKPAAKVLAQERRIQLAMLVPETRWTNSFNGKPASVVLFDGPPPRSEGPTIRRDHNRSFYVYTDKGSRMNHYAPSGWIGDWNDIQIDDASLEDPADGGTCFKVTYLGRGSQGHNWAAMYWQEPSNNWGDQRGGFNLKGMKRVTFWARGAHGGEQVAAFKVGGIRGRLPDTATAEIGPIRLTSEWKQYVIDVADANLSKLSGGFAWAVDRYDNAGPITFYIDEIRYER